MKVNYNNIYKSKSLPYGVCIKPVSFNYVLFASDKIYRYTLDEEIRILLSTGLKLTITYHKHQKRTIAKITINPNIHTLINLNKFCSIYAMPRYSNENNYQINRPHPSLIYDVYDYILDMFKIKLYTNKLVHEFELAILK